MIDSIIFQNQVFIITDQVPRIEDLNFLSKYYSLSQKAVVETAGGNHALSRDLERSNNQSAKFFIPPNGSEYDQKISDLRLMEKFA